MENEIKPGWKVYWRAMLWITIATLLSMLLIGVLDYNFKYELSYFINGLIVAVIYHICIWRYIKACAFYNYIEHIGILAFMPFLISISLAVGGYFISDAIDIQCSKAKTIDTLTLSDIDNSRYYDVKDLQFDKAKCKQFVNTDTRINRSGRYYEANTYLIYPIQNIPNAHYVKIYKAGFKIDSELSKNLDHWLNEKRKENESSNHKVVEIFDRESESYLNFQKHTPLCFNANDIVLKDSDTPSIPHGGNQIGWSIMFFLIIELLLSVGLLPKSCRYYLQMASEHRLDEIDS